VVNQATAALWLVLQHTPGRVTVELLL
jgi:hypothetical protein